jgi:hypothetical protein
MYRRRRRRKIPKNGEIRDINVFLGANFILVYCYLSSDCVSSIEILIFFELRVLYKIFGEIICTK